jgi:hypothetical protein
VVIAHCRAAADVAISNMFGPDTLKSFKVWIDEASESRTAEACRQA